MKSGQTAASKRSGMAVKLARCLLMPLLVLSLVLMPLGSTSTLQTAWAWTLPSLPGRQAGANGPQPLAPAPPGGRLQEVAAPVAVQQLQQALAEHLPQITISSPRDGATLPDGPWTLKLKLRDWPLADAGPLGLGAHVVVQIDDQPPQHIATGEGQQPSTTNPSGERELVLKQAPLTPGSHRLTVYAARPWGEAVKSPGAVRQIRLHRLAANPLSLPAAGTAQLLPVSPEASNGGEPLLLDWLLLDAPLQNLRDGDASWRLKVTINGDSFLVDQAVPLWLRGWKSGRNILQLELLDGLGAPLNPPFNSFVEAIDLAAPGADPATKPRWLQGRLSTDELAILLGDKAPPAIEPEPESVTDQEPQPEPQPEPEPDTEAESKATVEPAPDADATPAPEPEQTPDTPSPSGPDPGGADRTQAPAEADGSSAATTTLPPQPPAVTAEQPEPAAQQQGPASAEHAEADTDTAAVDTISPPSAIDADANQDQGHGANSGEPPNDEENPNETGSRGAPALNQTTDKQEGSQDSIEPDRSASSNTGSGGSLSEDDIPSARGIDTPEPGSSSPTPQTSARRPDPARPSDPEPSGLEGSPLPPAAPQASPAPGVERSATGPTIMLEPAPKSSPETRLEGAARDLVNPDGTLIQPPAQGPLAKLSQLLQR